MDLIRELCSNIVSPDATFAERAQHALDNKTKPPKSLGRLEELVCRIAAMRGSMCPEPPKKAVVVMAGDHGVAEEGVSAFPQEVTRQMLANFAAGGAAINVLTRRAAAELVVIDMGTKWPERASETERARVRSLAVAEGTHNFVHRPAMTAEQANVALSHGVRVADELAERGFTLIGLGEMGIANTTAASAITAVLARTDVASVTGSGTGIGLEARARKVAVIERAIARNAPDPKDARDVLAKLGGLEIAGLAGVCLGAAARRIPVVLDGFITSAAALVAARIEPKVAEYFIASHRSREPGHAITLELLRQRPLLELDLCLGEGSGAALALPLIDAAFAILHEMATFESASVSR